MNILHLGRVLGRCGRKATVWGQGGEARAVQAVISPLRYQNRMTLEGEHTPAGYVDGGRYLFISQHLPLVVFAGARVSASGAEYTVRRWETLYWGERPALSWAVLQLAAAE